MCVYIYLTNLVFMYASQNNAYIGKVTNETATNVEQLQKIGVRKVLVNNLHPVGCTSSQTRTNNYTAWNIFGNLGASIHNSKLKQVTESKKNVHIVDLYTPFTNIVDHGPGMCEHAYTSVVLF
jgi:hypothetical protein